MRLPVLLLVLFGLGSSVAAAAEPPDDGSDADFDADLDASVDASVDLDAKSPVATLNQGQIFGEQTAMSFTPRSA